MQNPCKAARTLSKRYFSCVFIKYSWLSRLQAFDLSANNLTKMGAKFSYFAENTTMHGFKYLAEDDRPLWKKIFARFIWSSVLAVSMYFMFLILSSSSVDFNTKTASINVDVNYRDWINTFPAVSVCMMKGRSTDKIKEHMIEYWKTINVTEPKRAIRFYRSIQALMFINYHQPLDGITLDSCLPFNETCGVDIEILKNELLPQSCSVFMKKVKFLGQEMKCEKIFKRHKTEIGECFTANSLYSNGKTLTDFRELPLKYSNQEMNERSLEINYIDMELVIFKLFIHTPEELPDGGLEGHGLRKANAQTYMAYKTTEIMNQPDVKDESVQDRQCRFPDEYLNERKLPYSISNCRFHQRFEHELESCNCTLPIGQVPKGFPRCNINQFQCIKDTHVKSIVESGLKDDDNDEHKDEGHKDHEVDHESECSVPTCVAMEIRNIGQYEKETHTDYGVLTIDIFDKPTVRYMRRVSFTKLDMIGEYFNPEN